MSDELMRYSVTFIIEADDDDDAQDQANEAYGSFHSIYDGPIVIPISTDT